MDQLLQYTHYILVILLFFVGIRIYLKIAIRKRIFDKTNGRSSHNYLTIRGGGVVFLIAGILLYYVLLQTPGMTHFLAGLLLVGIVSFVDDVKHVSIQLRILAQIAAISLAFYGVGLFDLLPWWALTLAYILFTGILNAYNFMDGINGMTGLFSLVVLGTLQWINLRMTAFAPPEFMWYGMLACGVFLCYNFRKRAICFAGDVGSLSLAFWVIFLLLKLMVHTHSFIWILLLSVYGVETVCTLLHRMYQKKSVFKAHRTFFFQILSNECNWPQLTVSSLYALTQLIISAIVIHFEPVCSGWCLSIILLAPLTAVYLLKIDLMERFCKKEEVLELSNPRT